MREFFRIFKISIILLVLASCATNPTVLNTAPDSYVKIARSKILRNLVYPPAALRAGETGRSRIRVEFRRDGTIIHVGLLNSTGHADLDQALLDVFKRIHQLPPIPDEYPGEAFVFEASLGFEVMDN